MTLGYLYSKFFKRVVRGTSNLNRQIDKTAKVYLGLTFYNLKLGRYSYVGYDSEVVNCEICTFCSIANGFVAGVAKHPMGWVSTSPVFYDVGSGTNHHLGKLQIENVAHIHIGHDVWIGSRAIIMQGVNVGTGSVIGAGAVVTKNVPPCAVVAGCPAKIIKYRFDNDIIDQLLMSEWWLFSDDKLKKLARCMNKPEVFLFKLANLEFLGRHNRNFAQSCFVTTVSFQERWAVA